MFLQRLLGLKFTMNLLFRVRAAIRCAKFTLRNAFLLREVLRIRREKIFKWQARREMSSF